MRKKLYVLLIGLPLVLLVSCQEFDSFLDKAEPHASLLTGSYYTNMADAHEAITVAYSTFNTPGIWDKDMLTFLGSIASDDAEAGGDFVNEVPAVEEFNRMVHTPANAHFFGIYGNLFRAIHFANLAITYLPQVAELDLDADKKLLNQRIAEAHFIRAINYFYLTKVFGGVPKVDKLIGPAEYEMPKASVTEIYRLIESDLKHAISVLPLRSGWGSEYGRASKGAAQALLARLYLYESSYAKNYPEFTVAGERFEGMRERWGEAFVYADSVINSGEYELVGINGERFDTWRGNVDGFRYIFTSNGDNSKEGVFEIQCIQEGLGWAVARGSSQTRWTSARYVLNPDGTEARTSDWGLNWPTQRLYDAFEPGDPRLRTTIAVPGDTFQIGVGLWREISFAKTATGYYTRKFESSWEEYNGVPNANWHTSPMNVRLIRFSEVYLIAAEAAYMSGQTAVALNYVNEVRKRARMSGDPGNTVPADLAAITLDAIKNERRIELAMEGLRFYDLVRWREEARLNENTVDDFDVVWEIPKHMFFPLPQREIDVSRGTLKQYDGW